MEVWNKINDVDTNWILTPNIKMFLSDVKQCTMFSQLGLHQQDESNRWNEVKL